MELTNLKRAVGRFFVAVLFLTFSANLQANYLNPGEGDKEKTAAELTKSLQAKVNLTENQITEVQKILVDYQKEVASVGMTEQSETVSSATSEIDNNTNTKIVALLDENQKIAFESFKSEWWQQIRSSVHPMQEDRKEESKENTY